MIYLIITTSVNNKYSFEPNEERKQRYLDSISKTLSLLPAEIIPIIVENNGARSTYLDNFTHAGKPVKVVYTNNNSRTFKSKGVTEFLDIKEVIQKYNINDNDIIIKLTGRYYPLSSKFFEEVIGNEQSYDAFVKFYGTCSLKFEQYDCILGCFAIKTMFIKLFNPIIINNYNSAEIGFARYLRFCGAKLKEITQLDIECKFSDDNRILVV